MLTSFSVENYRAFANEQTIKIRPLTLFFGKNSTGKSALVRFLPLLAESIQNAGTQIWLSGEVGGKTSWQDLVCKANRRTALLFSLEWKIDHQLYKIDWEIDADLKGTWQQTKSVTLYINQQKILDTFTPENTTLAWGELLKDLIPNDFPDKDLVLSQFNDAFILLSTQVQWIGGVRVRPQRIVEYGGSTSAKLSTTGADAIEHLIAAYLKSTEHPVLKYTQEFFAQLGEHLSIESVGAENLWRLLLSPTKALGVRVNICDTGEGYCQVLPILVALARARDSHADNTPRLLCLEQPELHLHTHAQTVLANLLVESANADTKPSILVETHSEVLLSSIQLAIAKGQISHDKVQVYWVESGLNGKSEIHPVDFNEFGQPTNTVLMGAFQEVIDIARLLMKTQMEKMQQL